MDKMVMLGATMEERKTGTSEDGEDEERLSTVPQRAINLDLLKQFQALFRRLEAEGRKVDEETFLVEFGSCSGRALSGKQLKLLYMKADAQGRGSITWDSFSDFLFSEASETVGDPNMEDETSHRFAPTQDPRYLSEDESRGLLKVDTVTDVKYMEKLGQFVSLSREGVVRLWDGRRLTPLFNLRTRESSSRHDFVVDAVHMHHSNKLAIASLHSCITVVDLSNEYKKVFGRVQHRELQQASPLTLDYHYDPVANVEHLFVGDNAGVVSIIEFPARAWALKDFFSLDGVQGQRTTRFRRHRDHVTKVMWVDDLQCLVTASLDSDLHVVDLERRKVKFTFDKHAKAVYTFEWCPGAKLIASAGLEQHIFLWSPYSRNTFQRLRGHSTSVARLIATRDQLISLSSNSCVKLWDIRHQKCLQTLELSALGEGDAITGIGYHPRFKFLVAASRVLRIFELRPPITRSATGKTHKMAVARVLYSRLYHQIVTLDAFEARVWHAATGQVACSFDTATDGRRPGLEVTAAALDSAGTRLFSGDHVGDRIKSWNFGTGEPIKRLVLGEDYRTELARQRKVTTSIRARAAPAAGPRPSVGPAGLLTRLPSALTDGDTPADGRRLAMSAPLGAPTKLDSSREVTAIEHLVVTSTAGGHGGAGAGIDGVQHATNFIVGTGWDRRIHVWLDAPKETDGGTISQTPEVNADFTFPDTAGPTHTEDVTCMACYPPHFVATGGRDGHVMFWNVLTHSRAGDLSVGPPVTCIRYLSLLSALVAGHQNGSLTVIDVQLGVRVAVIEHAHSKPVAITCMACSQNGDYLVTGDAEGGLKVWDVDESQYHQHVGKLREKKRVWDWEGPFLDSYSYWQAHGDSVTAVDYMESDAIVDTFVLSGSAQGDAMVWTINGGCVGMLGQRRLWDLRRIHTFRSQSPDMHAVLRRHKVRPDPTVAFRALRAATAEADEEGAAVAAESAGRGEGGVQPVATSAATATTGKQTAASEQEPPRGQLKAGLPSFTRRLSLPDMKDSIYTSRPVLRPCPLPASTRTNSGEGHKAREEDLRLPKEGDVWCRLDVEGELADLLTVTRVDLRQNTVEGWNGLAWHESSSPSLRFFLGDFGQQDLNSPSWRFLPDATRSQGRIFQDRVTGVLYKAFFFAKKGAKLPRPSAWSCFSPTRGKQQVFRRVSLARFRKLSMASSLGAESPTSPRRRGGSGHMASMDTDNDEAPPVGAHPCSPQHHPYHHGDKDGMPPAHMREVSMVEELEVVDTEFTEHTPILIGPGESYPRSMGVVRKAAARMVAAFRARKLRQQAIEERKLREEQRRNEMEAQLRRLQARSGGAIPSFGARGARPVGGGCQVAGGAEGAHVNAGSREGGDAAPRPGRPGDGTRGSHVAKSSGPGVAEVRPPSSASVIAAERGNSQGKRSGRSLRRRRAKAEAETKAEEQRQQLGVRALVMLAGAMVGKRGPGNGADDIPLPMTSGVAPTPRARAPSPVPPAGDETEGALEPRPPDTPASAWSKSGNPVGRGRQLRPSQVPPLLFSTREHRPNHTLAPSSSRTARPPAISERETLEAVLSYRYMLQQKGARTRGRAGAGGKEPSVVAEYALMVVQTARRASSDADHEAKAKRFASNLHVQGVTDIPMTWQGLKQRLGIPERLKPREFGSEPDGEEMWVPGAEGGTEVNPGPLLPGGQAAGAGSRGDAGPDQAAPPASPVAPSAGVRAGLPPAS